MSPQELYEAVKVCTNADWPMESYYIQVKAGEEVGSINPTQLIDTLITIGPIKEDTPFLVHFEDGGVAFHHLSEIEIIRIDTF